MAHLTCRCGNDLSNVGMPDPEIGEIFRSADLRRLRGLPAALAPFRALDSDTERYRWSAGVVVDGEEWLRSTLTSMRELADHLANDFVSPEDETKSDAWSCAACGRLWLEPVGAPTAMSAYRPTDESARLLFPRWPRDLKLRWLDPIPADQPLAELECACGESRTVTGAGGEDTVWLRPFDADFLVEPRLAELLALWMCGASMERAPLVGPDVEGLAPGDLLVGMALAFATRFWRLAWRCGCCARIWVQRYAGARAYVPFVDEPGNGSNPFRS